jgi:long-chain acyl-CoA synthetase
LLLYAPLKNALGMSRVRVAFTAGDIVDPDLVVLYRSLGINLKQLYGSTETSFFSCMQADDDAKPDSVGPPLPGVELNFTPDGELLIKSPGLFQEYYDDPGATRAAKDAAGWFHTGDAGGIDAHGHLKIIGRMHDVGRLAAGTRLAPRYLENRLKLFPYIKEAVCFGHQQSNVCAFINIDGQAVRRWAERRGLVYTSYADLASRNELYELVGDCVARMNSELAADPERAGLQIHRFLILPKELNADDEELTPTYSLRRFFITKKYAPLVKALYAKCRSVHVDAALSYGAGCAGKHSVELEIRTAKTVPSTVGLSTSQ